jgi:hypothetical protein
MLRLRRHHLAARLLVLALIGLVQVASLASVTASGSATSPAGGSAQLLEEEEVDDATVADDLVPLWADRGTGRWESEQHAPAPVHLERDGRPPCG